MFTKYTGVVLSIVFETATAAAQRLSSPHHHASLIDYQLVCKPYAEYIIGG
jgi:hypothetical protein